MQDRLETGKENRNFDTRLEFIANIFSHALSETERLASSVQFKLNKTYEIYLEEVNRSLSILASHDPTKVLSKIK